MLEDALWHIGKVHPETLLPAVHGPAWGYRHRARLTVRYVPKKGGALVGFHERRSSYVADMWGCAVLPPAIAALIEPLRGLVNALSIRSRLPQIEVAVGDASSVLVLRVLEAPSAADEALLREFAGRHGVWLYLQPGGPESAHPFHPAADAGLHYELPEFDLRDRVRADRFHPGQSRGEPRCWCAGRSRCSIRGPGSAWRISFAASAISPWRSRGWARA